SLESQTIHLTTGKGTTSVVPINPKGRAALDAEDPPQGLKPGLRGSFVGTSELVPFLFLLLWTATIFCMNFLRFLMLLALAVWLGALVFFPFVAATAFSALPSTHMAGLVVRGSLLNLHTMGFVCGVVFLICSLIYNRLLLGRSKALAFSHILIVLMLALTAISQFRIIPQMEALRLTAGEINQLASSNPVRVQFESLHVWSTRVEGAVLALGIILLYVTANRLAITRP